MVGETETITLRMIFKQERNKLSLLMLDYDIAVQGDSVEAAVAAAVEATRTYLETGLAEGKSLHDLRRPAPLSYQLRFVLYAIEDAFRSRRRRDGGKTPNVYQCPLLLGG